MSKTVTPTNYLENCKWEGNPITFKTFDTILIGANLERPNIVFKIEDDEYGREMPSNKHKIIGIWEFETESDRDFVFSAVGKDELRSSFNL